jgi:hypothetical protein
MATQEKGGWMIREVKLIDGVRVVVETPFPPVSRLQARRALGPEQCAILDAIVDDESIPWTMREAIRSATEWRRDAQEITELAWVLGLTQKDIDNLFIDAMAL